MGARPAVERKKMVREVKDFDSGAFGDAGIGQKDLIELKNRGYSKGAISRFVDSERDKGTAIGGRVEGSLELMGARAPRQGPIKGYNYKDFGDCKGFGFADVRELSRQGYGQDQIRSHMEDLRKQGVKIGERAGMSIDLMAPSQDRMDAHRQEIEDRMNAKNQAEGLRLAGSVFRPDVKFPTMPGGSLNIPAPRFHGIK